MNIEKLTEETKENPIITNKDKLKEMSPFS